jgi:threonine dehydratase
MATVSLQDIEEARVILTKSEQVFRTPLVRLPSKRLGIPENVELYAKMENMQNTGSFKVRGFVNMLEKAPKELHSGEIVPITMSAGNFARAFAQVLSAVNIKGKVLMPDAAPKNRRAKIESFGMEVELHHVSKLQPTIDSYVSKGGMLYLHPFDDLNLIAGHGSAGLEMLEDLSNIDIVVVCCGGGGLLAGVAAAVKQSGGELTKVIGVEPEGAPTMYLSMQEGHPVVKNSVRSVAAGLCPPFAGEIAYRHVVKFVDDIVLVSDEQILHAAKSLFSIGILVEPSGAAALAAVQSSKIESIDNKRIVVTLSGSNITPEEVAQLY